MEVDSQRALRHNHSMQAIWETRILSWAAIVFTCLCGTAFGADASPNPSHKNSLPPSLSRPVDFAKEVQPLLSNTCYECHGPQKQKGALRLDQKAAALRGGDSGALLVAGKSA